jgi:hypothetical protein
MSISVMDGSELLMCLQSQHLSLATSVQSLGEVGTRRIITARIGDLPWSLRCESELQRQAFFSVGQPTKLWEWNLLPPLHAVFPSRFLPRNCDLAASLDGIV